MRVAVCLITGFAQPFKISAGLAELREKLLPLDLAVLEFFCWKARPDLIANKLDHADRVLIVGHSFGSWKGSLVCNELDRRGRRVWGFFNADGVSRDHPRVLTFPPFVERIYSWRQDKNKLLNGSPLKFTTYTKLVVDEMLDVRHNRVDETPALHAQVLKAATTE